MHPLGSNKNGFLATSHQPLSQEVILPSYSVQPKVCMISNSVSITEALSLNHRVLSVSLSSLLPSYLLFYPLLPLLPSSLLPSSLLPSLLLPSLLLSPSLSTLPLLLTISSLPPALLFYPFLSYPLSRPLAHLAPLYLALSSLTHLLFSLTLCSLSHLLSLLALSSLTHLLFSLTVGRELEQLKLAERWFGGGE